MNTTDINQILTVAVNLNVQELKNQIRVLKSNNRIEENNKNYGLQRLEEILLLRTNKGIPPELKKLVEEKDRNFIKNNTINDEFLVNVQKRLIGQDETDQKIITNVNNPVEVGVILKPDLLDRTPDATRVPDPDIAELEDGKGDNGQKEWPNWVLTVWNKEELSRIEDNPNSHFFVYQCEIAPKTGKEHYQCYLELTRSRDFTWMKNNISRTAYLYRRRGTQAEAIIYCCKQESRKPNTGPFIFGKPKRAGARTDWGEILQMCKDKKTVKDIMYHFPDLYGKCHKGIERMIQVENSKPPRNSRIEIQFYILYSNSGKGKTSKILEKHGHENVYIKDATIWWNDYKHQKIVLFDEANYIDRSPSEWHRIIDIHPCSIQTKGGYDTLSSLIFIITTSDINQFNNFLSDPDLKRRLDDYGDILTMEDFGEYKEPLIKPKREYKKKKKNQIKEDYVKL